MTTENPNNVPTRPVTNGPSRPLCSGGSFFGPTEVACFSSRHNSPLIPDMRRDSTVRSRASAFVTNGMDQGRRRPINDSRKDEGREKARYLPVALHSAAACSRPSTYSTADEVRPPHRTRDGFTPGRKNPSSDPPPSTWSVAPAVLPS